MAASNFFWIDGRGKLLEIIVEVKLVDSGAFSFHNVAGWTVYNSTEKVIILNSVFNIEREQVFVSPINPDRFDLTQLFIECSGVFPIIIFTRSDVLEEYSKLNSLK